MEKENCVFCKIVRGDIPSTTVYEDEYCRGIMDISPASEGHVILLAKKHKENVFELGEEDTGKIFIAAKKIAAAMMEALGCAGINILQNNGQEAGQTVFHFHVHVVPRYEGDTVDIKWKLGSYEDGAAMKLAGKIQEKLKK